MIQEIKKISAEHCILQVENLKCASDDYRQERHMWKKKKPRRSLEWNNKGVETRWDLFHRLIRQKYFIYSHKKQSVNKQSI